MMPNMSQMLPLVTQLGTYLKTGIDHYSDLRAAGGSASPDMVAVFLKEKMSAWNPKVGKKELLDDETKTAAARFLAGVAINFSNA